MQTRIARWFRCASIGILLLAGASVADDAGMAAQQAISQQVERINEAWKSDGGAEIMRSVLSDHFMVSFPDPRGPNARRTMNKEVFCSAFARMSDENRPKKHVRQTIKITVKGSVAYENGVSIHVTDTGSKRHHCLNVWRQEGDTWRLFVSVPMSDLRESLRPR